MDPLGARWVASMWGRGVSGATFRGRRNSRDRHAARSLWVGPGTRGGPGSSRRPSDRGTSGCPWTTPGPGKEPEGWASRGTSGSLKGRMSASSSGLGLETPTHLEPPPAGYGVKGVTQLPTRVTFPVSVSASPGMRTMLEGWETSVSTGPRGVGVQVPRDCGVTPVKAERNPFLSLRHQTPPGLSVGVYFPDRYGATSPCFLSLCRGVGTVTPRRRVLLCHTGTGLTPTGPLPVFRLYQ